MILNHYAGSDRYGMEFRPLYMAREWVRLGHEAVVVAADYSHLRKINPEVKKSFDEEIIDGVRYVFIKTPAYHGNGAGRALNMAAFLVKVFFGLGRLAKKYAPQAVIASSTYPFDFYLARRLAKKTHGDCYFEIHDLWPLTQIELYGMSVKNIYVRLLQRAEDTAFRASRKVISILPGAYKHMEERGVPRDKFVYIPNGVSLGERRPAVSTPQAAMIRHLRAEGKFIVLYLGGFALANALDELVGAAALLGDDTRVVLVGDGPKKRELMEANRAGDRVLFLDGVPKDAVPDVLGAADCLYIGAKRCSLYRYGAGMNKLYDYMLAAKPVICGIEAMSNPVAEVGCGVVIPPQDEKEIARAVEALRALSAEERAEMGRNGRDYVIKNHDYRVLARKFADSLKRE